jgi:predicted RNase H-like HicB family nuclease
MPIKDLSYYLGLRYPIEVHESAGGYFVTHPDLDGCMAEGATLEEAVTNLADSRELWIEARLEGGYNVPEPVSEEYSGRISLRMTPELHGQLARIAERRGVSLNLLLNSVLAAYSGGAEPLFDTIHELKSAVADLRAATSSISNPRPASPLSEGPFLQSVGGKRRP